MLLGSPSYIFIENVRKGVFKSHKRFGLKVQCTLPDVPPRVAGP